VYTSACKNKHCVLDCCQPRNLCLFAVTSPGHIVQTSAIWICIRPFASPMEEVVLAWVLLVWRSTLLDYGHPILWCVTSFSVFSICPCLSILHVCVADLHHFKALNMFRLAHVSDFSVLSCMLELGTILLDDVYNFHTAGVWCLQLPTGGIPAPENAQPLAVISLAPWGSALILPIWHSYISIMGS
jgi:hypothetical protein